MRGGRFGNILVHVGMTTGDRIQHTEAFGADDAERALARFEELCAERAVGS